MVQGIMLEVSWGERGLQSLRETRSLSFSVTEVREEDRRGGAESLC